MIRISFLGNDTSKKVGIYFYLFANKLNEITATRLVLNLQPEKPRSVHMGILADIPEVVQGDGIIANE